MATRIASGRTQALDAIRDIVHPKGWIDDADGMAPYLKEWRGNFHGQATAVVRPGSTEEVARVVGVCADAGIGIVPQSGNTGLVGGAVPYEHGRDIILTTERLDRIRSVDPLNYTITVEAGVILQNVQAAAAEADRLFPLSLGSEGSCRIGGNLSTNAGGTGVLRYGNARDLLLGLEVVLPDGRVWNGLRGLRKDNTGYDLKHLFVGAEGTLGIVTAAVLKLFPRPKRIETALAAIRDPAAGTELLARARMATGDAVTACELIPRIGLDFALRHVAGTIDPLEAPHDWYLLLEFSSPVAEDPLRERLESVLAQGMEAGLVRDATIAASSTQGRQLWFIREAIVEGQRFEGGSIKHDISVPVARTAEFVERACEAVEKRLPGIRPVAFGHLGDGNIHLNLSQPVGADGDAYLARWEEFNEIVHGIVTEMDGSISAEHGIGRLKREKLPHYRSAIELELMRRVKKALDPADIMNPGKVV
ncbi:MAG: FAD-binding oxidoreductase [Inquilinus sp.]|nr:FAD-binding oxidoreductase [Inquilinus sp.]